MSKTLDAQIDALYAVPLSQFVTARTALAKTVTGAEAKRIKSLAKPTTLPWVVNQLRWHERARYERVVKTGAAFRRAQIATLEGRASRGHETSTAHKDALADALKAAMALAANAGVHVDADALLRMLETISTADSLKEAHGRFTEVVQPAGLEALLGIAVKTPVAGRGGPPTPPAKVREDAPASDASLSSRAALRLVEQQQRERAEAAARRAEAVRIAERALAKARAEEAEALRAWHEARDRADAADRALIALKKSD